MNYSEFMVLADRCETEQPSNVLNRAIARALGWGYQTPSEAGRKNPAWFHPDDVRDGHIVFDSLHGTEIWREPEQYVFSVDAAMKLIPAGHSLRLETAGGTSTVYADVWNDAANYDGVPKNECRASGAALAITASALRAIFSLNAHEEVA